MYYVIYIHNMLRRLITTNIRQNMNYIKFNLQANRYKHDWRKTKELFELRKRNSMQEEKIKELTQQNILYLGYVFILSGSIFVSVYYR